MGVLGGEGLGGKAVETYLNTELVWGWVIPLSGGSHTSFGILIDMHGGEDEVREADAGLGDEGEDRDVFARVGVVVGLVVDDDAGEVVGGYGSHFWGGVVSWTLMLP